MHCWACVCVCVWKQEPVSGRVDLVVSRFFLIPPPYDYFNICPKKKVARETFFFFSCQRTLTAIKGKDVFFLLLLFASSPLSSHSNQPTHNSTHTQPCLSLPIKESPSASGSTDASTSCTLVSPHQPNCQPAAFITRRKEAKAHHHLTISDQLVLL